jgi:hypothetical protein
MPEQVEDSIREEAEKLYAAGKLNPKGKKKSRKDAVNAYVFGTMRDLERKHEAKGGTPGKYMKET